MPRRGRNIYLRKDGRWEGRYRRDDHGILSYGSLYGKTYSEVREKLSVLEVRLEKKETSILMKKEYHMSYSDWMQLYLEKQQCLVKESTFARYKSLVIKHINPFFEKTRLSELTSTLINHFIATKLINGRLDGKGGLAPKTVRDIAVIVRASIQLAEKQAIIPMISDKMILPKLPQSRAKTLPKKDLDLLMEKLFEGGDIRDYGILMALFTGLRIGELCALKWKDICFEKSQISVSKTIQRIHWYEEDSEIEKTSETKVIISSPKSSASNRKVPLPSVIKNLLKNFKRHYSREAYFLSGNPQRCVEPRTFQYYFKSKLKNYGISDINFHALRHTFATQCVEASFDLKSLSEILGHASVNITLNRYVHPSFESKQRQIEQLISKLRQ